MKKYLIIVLFIGLISFSSIARVNAKTLTISEVDSKLKELLKDDLEELGSTLTSNIDEENKKVDLLIDNDTYVTYNYTNEYIEYNNRTATVPENITDEFLGKSSTEAILILGNIYAILNLSGYNDKEVIDEKLEKIKDTVSYNTYGIDIETEEFEKKSDNTTYSGIILKYFKMSLNTDKFKALMEDNNKNEPQNTTPSQEIKPSNPTTAQEESIVKEDKQELKNPNTGLFFPIIIAISLVIGSISIIIIAKKKNSFKRI